MIAFTANVRLDRPDGLGRPATRTFTFNAPSEQKAWDVVGEEARKGGYSGYRLSKVFWLTAADVVVPAPESSRRSAVHTEALWQIVDEFDALTVQRKRAVNPYELISRLREALS